MEITQRITLDFARRTMPITVFAKQYDKDTRTIEITPLNNGAPYSIGNGITAQLQMTKPDGHTVNDNASISNGIITVTLTAQALAAAGTAEAEIGLYEGTTLLSSQVFYIDIQKGAYNKDSVESSDEYNIFIEALERAESATTEAQAAAISARAIENEIQTKLNRGEFIGEKGDKGDKGDTGAQGPAVPIDTTLSITGQAADSKAVGDILYRTKNKTKNIPAALTCWNAMSTYTSENPASPVDMPVNSWAFASGAVMAGFNNEVFTLLSTGYYWFLCIGNTVSALTEPARRHYLIWSSTGAYMFTGNTSNSAETVSWRDRSYVDVRSEINNALIGYRQVIDQLYQSSTDTTGYSISANGTISTNAVFQYSDLISVEPNTEYLFSFHAGASSSYVARIIGYDSNSSYTRQLAAILQSPNADNSIRFVTSGKERYIRISRPTQSNNCVLLFSSPQVIQNNNNVLSFGPIKSYGYKGAKVSILGASISTFSGYIVEGNSAYYPHETANAEPVSDVHDTYWQKFIDALGAEILVNNSSAGSYCSTGHGSSYDAKAGCGSRCEALDDGTNMPDIIIIQLGGNDFTRSTPLGSYDGTQSFPTDTTTFREAYAVMLNKITTKYTDAMVICGTIPIITGGVYVTRTFPSKNLDQGEGKPGGVLLEEYNKAIRELAALFGCKVVEFSRCGLTFNNVSIYMQDYSASSNYGQHPNRLGHHLMANELLRTIDQSGFKMYRGV